MFNMSALSPSHCIKLRNPYTCWRSACSGSSRSQVTLHRSSQHKDTNLKISLQCCHFKKIYWSILMCAATYHSVYSRENKDVVLFLNAKKDYISFRSIVMLLSVFTLYFRHHSLLCDVCLLLHINFKVQIPKKIMRTSACVLYCVWFRTLRCWHLSFWTEWHSFSFSDSFHLSLIISIIYKKNLTFFMQNIISHFCIVRFMS